MIDESFSQVQVLKWLTSMGDGQMELLQENDTGDIAGMTPAMAVYTFHPPTR